MLDIQYNGIRSSSLKVFAKEYPNIAPAQRAYKEIQVPGIDGIFLQDEGRFESTEIPILMNYIGPERKWHERWTMIQDWLSKTNCELILSDDSNYYYRVSRVNLSENGRKGRRIGDFTATFVTKDGLRYLRTGKHKYDLKDLTWNPGETAFPDYYISGVGTCMLSVNGKGFEVKINGAVIVDTERHLIYEPNKTIVNNLGKGDFENLYLEHGQNEISASKDFDAKAIPHWRCR